MRCVNRIKLRRRAARRSVARAAIGTAMVVFAASVPAAAFERQWRVGGGGGIAILTDAPVGPAVGAHLGYGISDLFDWNVELLASRHFDDEPTTVGSVATGLSYKIDVFEWIPYAGLLGTAYVFDGAPGPNGESGLELGASVFGGLDHLFSRDLAAGIQIREHAIVSDGVNFPYFTVTLRVEHRWGF